MSHIQPSFTFIFLRWDLSNEFAGPSISNEHRNNAEYKCKEFWSLSDFPTRKFSDVKL